MQPSLKRLLLGFVVAVALFVVPIYAQAPCPTCYMRAWVDIPGLVGAPSSFIVSAGSAWGAAGWGFLCANGQGPDRVDVWYQKADGTWGSVPGSAITLVTFDRPDVRAAFTGQCPQVAGSTNVGWWIGVSGGAVPSGTSLVAFNIWHTPYRYDPTDPNDNFFWNNTGFVPQPSAVRAMLFQ